MDINQTIENNEVVEETVVEKVEYINPNALSKQERMEMNQLSIEVFGVPSKWKNLLTKFPKESFLDLKTKMLEAKIKNAQQLEDEAKQLEALKKQEAAQKLALELQGSAV